VNDESLCVVQIETFMALSNVKDIAATPGVDVLFVGPGDLSAALGCPGQLGSEVYLEALDYVVAAARGARVAAGIARGRRRRRRGSPRSRFQLRGRGVRLGAVATCHDDGRTGYVAAKLMRGTRYTFVR
jgi:hypothetical protein